LFNKIVNALFIDKALKEDISFLKTVPLFKGLSDRSLSKIATIIYKKTYHEGENIYAPAQEANLLYIVKSGVVNIECRGTKSVLGEGSFFGELSLIEFRNHEGIAKASKDSLLYLVYRVKFDDLVESDAHIGLRIMKNLSRILALRIQCV
jgi:signal-transduction protein with cAMP-binding, CBS, and nucleotidyltransferase domain